MRVPHTLIFGATLVLAVSAGAASPDLDHLQTRLDASEMFPAGTTVIAAEREGAVLHVDLLPGEPVGPDQVDELVRAVDHALGEGVRGVGIRLPDEFGVMRTLPELFDPEPVEDKGVSVPPGYPPVDHPGGAEGALSGKTIYLSQSHGWYYHESYDSWLTQRPNLFDTVEDFHNPEGMNQYLMRYLLNAGAHVVTVRESDLLEEMVIVDDAGSGYAETGAWADSDEDGFAAGQAPYAYGTDPFELGGARQAATAAAATATARWTAEIPRAGRYNVYVSYPQDPQAAPDAHYVIHHPGGDSDVHVDQRRHGSTWAYVGRFWFEAGSDADHGSVELLNDSSDSSALVSADAVRFGGGVGDVQREGTLSGHERWEEAAIYYTQYAGAPTSVYDPYSDGNGSDPSSRSRFADWEHEDGEDALYFSWHSNAGGGQGTSTYIYGPCAPGEGCGFTGYEGSEEFAEFVQENLVDAITAQWQADWSDRGVRVAYFSEVSPSNNDEMPAALIELAFHDHEDDTALLKHPLFRRDTSRAMMHGMIDYFAWRDGLDLTYPPEPPTHLQVKTDAPGVLRVTWEAPPHGAPQGDAADSYRVYLSLDGRSFDDGVEVQGTEALVEGLSGYDAVFVRVTSVNAGGESFPAPVLGAVPSPAETRILFVDGFDRQDRTMLLYRDAGGSIGEVVHMDLEHMNRHDFSVEHLRALADLGLPADSADSAVVAEGMADDYLLVVWGAGNEGTEDESFSDAEQAWVEQHVAGGGRLFVSGAEIGWDLYERGGESDIAFYADTLLAALAADDADTYQVEPEPSGIFAGIGPLAFDDGSEEAYDVRYPDVLDVLGAGEPVMYYDGDAGLPAALAGPDLVYLGFPFETILGEAERLAVMWDAIAYLIPDYEPPEWDDVGDDDDDDDGDDDDNGGDDDGPAPHVTDPADDGCGCRTDGAGTPAALGLGLALVALRIRRRR